MIYIITVYDSLNYGSYFQAVSLSHFLSSVDKTAFLDIKHQSTFLQTLKKIAAHIVKKRFKGVPFEIEKLVMYRNCKKGLLTIQIAQLKGGKDDVFVFGSDEIWNLHRKKIARSQEFWGVGLPEGKKIAYAPSINEATLEEYRKNELIVHSLQTFDYISVRDERSQSVIQNLVNKPVDIVVDPTLLVGSDFFHKIQRPCPLKKSFILLYTYGKMCKTNEQIKEIADFAKAQGCELVSIGKYLSWCDKSLNPTPEEFLGYVHSARLVITDTFHGTIFSILYHKVFINVNPAPKISGLLRKLNLEDRVINDVRNLNSAMCLETDYQSTDALLSELVKDSETFLYDSLTSMQ